MKTILARGLLLSLISSGFSCSSDRPARVGTFNQAAGANSTTGPVKTDDGTTADAESSSLNLIANAGSSMRFIDGYGLTAIYQNVFTKKEFGYMHCASNKPMEISFCDSIFSPSERASMGMFDLYSSRMGRAQANVNPPVNLTLNYTRSLRAALSRECISLVDAEIAKFNAKDIATNLLVKAAAPTSVTLDDFMKKLLGVGGTPIAIDSNTAGYVTAFAATVEANKDKTVGMRTGYVDLCIALTMDPLVFIY